jgi:hypothetical protein
VADRKGRILDIDRERTRQHHVAARMAAASDSSVKRGRTLQCRRFELAAEDVATPV